MPHTGYKIGKMQFENRDLKNEDLKNESLVKLLTSELT